jgi:hypothetical protein
MYQDYKDLLSAFHAHGVRLIVGGYAVIFHAQPRFTKDLDLFIKADPPNSQATYAALAAFGAPLRVFLRALKPGGLVVYQSDERVKPDWTKLSDNWEAFHLLRLEDEDPGYVENEWSPSPAFRTTMLVARKE